MTEPTSTPKTKLAKDLKPGDVVTTEAGEVVKITRVSKGIFPGSVYIKWNGGFADQPGNDEIEVK